MLDWFSETMLKIVMSVPALFVAEDSPTFMAVRVMFGLILIVLVAVRHCHAAVSLRRCMGKMSDVFARKR